MVESSTTYFVAQCWWKENPSCISMIKLDGFILLTAACRSTTVQREQWLCDRATVLHYTCIAYLVWCVDSEEVVLDMLMTVI